MTVRDATRRESPDGNVLYIEELRGHLGVRTDASEGFSPSNATKTRPEVLLIGHDMNGDFRKMAQDGIDVQKYFDYLGCVDTHVIIEDTGSTMGKSLGALVYHYDLAKPEYKSPMCPSIPRKLSFAGSHCAGNDAIVTAIGALSLALDLSLKTSGRHENTVNEGELPEDWLQKPLQGMNKNLILLAYDTEGVETPRYKPDVRNRTSEHGFAWLRIAEIAHIPPGRHGENWRPYVRAEHWINHDFRSFSNRYFCVGNPHGFWPRYGKSQYYRVTEGPAPFHRLFEELAGDYVGAIEGDDAVGEVTKTLEQTTLGGDFPAVGGNAASVEGEMTKELTNASGKQPAWRANVMGTREVMTSTSGNVPDFGATAKSLRGNPGTNKGNGRSWAQVAQTNTSII